MIDVDASRPPLLIAHGEHHMGAHSGQFPWALTSPIPLFAP